MKGTHFKCDNWGSIYVFSTARKIIAKIILERFKADFQAFKRKFQAYFWELIAR